MQVSYTKIITNHDGYCSDPGESYEEEHDTYTDEIDIPFEIATNDKYLDKDIIFTFNKIREFYIEDDDFDEDSLQDDYNSTDDDNIKNIISETKRKYVSSSCNCWISCGIYIVVSEIKFKNTFTGRKQIETLKKYYLNTEKSILKLEDEIKFLEFINQELRVDTLDEQQRKYTDNEPKPTYRTYESFDILNIKLPDDIKLIIDEYFKQGLIDIIKDKIEYKDSLVIKKEKLEILNERLKYSNFSLELKCIICKESFTYDYYQLLGFKILQKTCCAPCKYSAQNKNIKNIFFVCNPYKNIKRI